ncbi:hypothetical protein AAMO2058_001062400 [Amorphochlora amoebiformis]
MEGYENPIKLIFARSIKILPCVLSRVHGTDLRKEIKSHEGAQRRADRQSSCKFHLVARRPCLSLSDLAAARAATKAS